MIGAPRAVLYLSAIAVEAIVSTPSLVEYILSPTSSGTTTRLIALPR